MRGVTLCAPSLSRLVLRGWNGLWFMLALCLPVPQGLAEEQTLLPFGSSWRWRKGTNEVSNPTTAWRERVFDDAGWLTGPMPFFYGVTNVSGTALSDMRNKYTTIYLRSSFVVTNLAAIGSITLRERIDDGFIVWINGTQVQRYNVYDGEQPYTAGTPLAISPVDVSTNLINPASFLVSGTNVIAVHGINRNLTSSDFILNLEVKATIAPPGPPVIAAVTPPAGSTVSGLRQVTVTFSEPTQGVDASDLLVNGVPATAVSGASGTNVYVFAFAQPAPGIVPITWSAAHGIRDLAGEAFDASGPGATWNYTIVPPAVAGVVPAPGSTVDALTQISVTFNGPVAGVQAEDFLVNGLPAATVSGSGSVWTYSFTQPVPGQVQVNFEVNHTITDFLGSRFDQTAPSASWQYTLADRLPPTVLATAPVAGATVGALNGIDVTFNEAVTGVNAADLLVNGQPAAQVTGALAGPYRFEFPQPIPGTVTISWTAAHGIRDTSPAANAFAGAGWSYLLNSNAAFGNIVINEFLADNLAGLLDEDGQKQDWIELWNRGANNVNLLGWSLTDDPADPGRWTFPAVTLNAGQYMVVFASGKDRKPTAVGGKLHTNFRLNADGDYLGLFNSQSPPQPVSEFAPAFPEQRANVAYGFTTSNTLAYFTTPTPGAANNLASVVTNFVEAPTASVKSGFFDRSFTLLLSTPTPGAEIRYTLDGSVPTAGSTLYGGPMLVEGNPLQAVVMVRSAAFKPGWLSSTLSTHSYFFLEHVLTQPADPAGFPAVWDSPCSIGGNCIDTPGDYEMDPQVLTDVTAGYAAMARQGLVSIPTLSIVTDVNLLFGPAEGVYVRREPFNQQPVHAEYLLPDGSEGFKIDCGMEIQGQTSPTDAGSDWKSKKLSLRLIFQGDFGATKLRYKLFPDSFVEEFDTLIVSAGANMYWNYMPNDDQRTRAQYVRDQYVSDLQNAAGGLAPHGRFVHLYLNGLYWGLHEVHERPDHSFSASYLGGDKGEYDSLKHDANTVVSGSNAAYNQMLALARSGLADPAVYERLQEYLDVPWLIDYLLINFWAGNEDWAHKNWYASRRRTPDGRFRYFAWDSEHVLKGATYDATTKNQSGSPTELFHLLRANTEFRVLFGDHVHRHCFNGGILYSDPSNPPWNPAFPERNRPAQRYLTRIAEIDPAIVCESARWGDVGISGVDRRNNPLTRNVEWLNEMDALLGLRNNSGYTWNFFPPRTANVLSQLRAQGVYPSVVAPIFNQHGGVVSAGFPVTMSAPAGTIYFTTNGVDPRVYGSGTVAAQAAAYTGPVPLFSPAIVKARVLSAGNWSALNEATFTVNSLGSSVRITEINYNPSDGYDAHEFIELQNTGPLAVDLSGFGFEGINYSFPDGIVLAPGAVLVLANDANPAAFASRYPGVVVSGYFEGSLLNGGERIALLDRNSQVVTVVHYDDEDGWPKAADGGGYTLEIIDPQADPNAPANWRASAVVNGTPGLPPSLPTLPGAVRLNEVMADNYSTITNAGTLPDWVELHNRGTTSVNLAQWSLSDDSDPRKFVFPPGTTLTNGGYLLVWCDTATNAPGLHTGFALGRNGDNVFLYDANTNRVDALTFGLQIPDRTLGRINEAWQLNLPTPGSNNVAVALADSTSLALNEWLANPAAGQDDWVELFNRSFSAPVALQGLYLGISNTVSRMQSLSFIAPRGYALLHADEQPGANHLEFKLPATGGTLTLRSAGAALLDQVSYGPQQEAVSEGRLPDGNSGFATFNGSASPGASNYVIVYFGPVLNEVLARNQRAVVSPWGNYADFFELYNPATTNVSLAGFALGTSEEPTDRWVFPTGTTVAAGGYLRVWCDGERAPSTDNHANMNTGFSLDGESGDVILFNLAGHPVDRVGYGFQVPDLSIGRNGGTWQLLAVSTPGSANAPAAALGSASDLRINEWMAAGSGDDWFELYNPGLQPVALGGLFLTDDPSITGITNSPVAPLSFIGGGDWTVWIADGERSAGRHHVNFALDQFGETIRLYSAGRVLLDAVDFGVQTTNVSQGRLPDGAANLVSFPATPTPGGANYLPLTNLVINEVLTHTDPPLEDALEIFNPTAERVEIGGWYLSDSQSDLKRYRIPDGTGVSARGYQVFYQAEFGPADGETDAPPLFTFNAAHGDAVYLSEANAFGELTGYRAETRFGAATNGISFGRYQTSVGTDFVAMSRRTFGVDNPANVLEFRTGGGLSNAYPRVGPVVINEIMYHPAQGTNTKENPAEEFIELYNLSAASVPLRDPAHPTNAWRLGGAVTFEFPTNSSIAPGGYIIVVPFDPVTDSGALAAFQARYGPQGNLAGPFRGRLDNAGEALELWRPDAPQTAPRPDAGFVPYFLVDRVAYSDAAPWPIAADGGGASLQRLVSSHYGNDPVNWKADQPTANRTNSPAAGEPPIVLVPPQNLSSIAGTRAEFTVVADGTAPLGYQWLFNNAPLAGREGTNLVLNPVQISDAGEYRVQVTNIFGRILSAPATLTVLVPPQIVTSPQSQAVNLGASVSMGVVATGTAPLSYQWQRNGSPMAGQTLDTLLLTSVSAMDAGSYWVVVTNLAGGATSAVAVLTVQSPPVITLQPQGGFAPLGGSIILRVSASGDAPLSYQWRFQGSNLPGATSTALALNHLGAQHSGRYDVRVTNLAGSVLSEPAVLTVIEPPTLVQPQFLPEEGFTAMLVGPMQRTYAVETSTNLIDWVEIGTLVHTNTATSFIDPTVFAPPRRYYRARLVE